MRPLDELKFSGAVITSLLTCNIRFRVHFPGCTLIYNTDRIAILELTSSACCILPASALEWRELSLQSPVDLPCCYMTSDL